MRDRFFVGLLGRARKEIIMKPSYLGDGVYALPDEFMRGVWLHLNDHEHPTDRIFLEPEVFNALVEYWKWMNDEQSGAETP